MSENYNNDGNRSLLDMLDSAEERAKTTERKPQAESADAPRRGDDSVRTRPAGDSRSSGNGRSSGDSRRDGYDRSSSNVSRSSGDGRNSSASRNSGDRSRRDGDSGRSGSSRDHSARRDDPYRSSRNSDGRVNRRDDYYRDDRSPGNRQGRSGDANRSGDRSGRRSGDGRESRSLVPYEKNGEVGTTRNRGEVTLYDRNRTAVGNNRSRADYNRNRYYGSQYGKGRKRKKKSKGSKSFRIGLIIFAAVFALAVTIAIMVLSSFLTTYESSLPVNVVEQVIEELKEGRYEGMNIVAYDETPISDEAAYAKDGFFNDYFKNHMSAGEVTYRKLNGESTDTNFVYAVKVADEDFLKIKLNKQDEKQKFDLSTWEMAGGQVLDDKLVTKTIRIQGPQNAKVYINGIEVGDDKIVSSNVVVEQLQNLVNSGFIAESSAAYVKELSVEGLFADGDTKVTLTNEDGTEEECVLNNDLYSGGFKATDEFVSARIDRVTEMIYPWCYYFSGDGSFWELSQYIWDYSPAYNTIQAADTSWMQEHSDIGIDNIVVDNFRNYSDTCWSCDVRFQENIYQWGTLARTWDSYMTWVYVNGDSTFYMADYITHNASEN